MNFGKVTFDKNKNGDNEELSSKYILDLINQELKNDQKSNNINSNTKNDGGIISKIGDLIKNVNDFVGSKTGRNLLTFALKDPYAVSKYSSLTQESFDRKKIEEQKKQELRSKKIKDLLDIHTNLLAQKSSDLPKAVGSFGVYNPVTKSLEKMDTLDYKDKSEYELKVEDRLNKGASAVKQVYQFRNNIESFMDPKKATSVVKLDGGQAITVDDKHNFQNVRDIAIIYSFIKMLDQNSTVREGEVKLTDEAKGALQRLGIDAKKVLDGQTLDNKQRLGMLSVANDSLLNSANDFYSAYEIAQNRIESYKLNRDNIISKEMDDVIKTIDILRNKSTKNITRNTNTANNKKFIPNKIYVDTQSGERRRYLGNNKWEEIKRGGAARSF